jgi:hypothetical protein
VPEHRVRHVRRLELGDVFARQLERERGRRIVELLQPGRADDRGRDLALGQHPRQRDLRARPAQPRRDRRQGLGHLAIGVGGLRIERAAEAVGLRARARRVPVARQPAAGERAPRDDGDALVAAQRQHLALLLAVEQVDVVLHRLEAGPAVRLGHVQRLRELPGEHRRRADVQGLAGAHDVVQRLERFLDRHRRVPAMDLVQVDEVGAQALQAGIDLREDGLARQAHAVRPLVHALVDLGRDDDLAAACVLEQGPADDLLARAVGVHVGGVEEVDAEIQGLLQERAARRLAQGPGVRAAVGLAIAHAAEAKAGDIEAGAAELGVLHGVLDGVELGAVPAAVARAS